jgi:hypothetical protein
MPSGEAGIRTNNVTTKRQMKIRPGSKVSLLSLFLWQLRGERVMQCLFPIFYLPCDSPSLTITFHPPQLTQPTLVFSNYSDCIFTHYSQYDIAFHTIWFLWWHVTWMRSATYYYHSHIPSYAEQWDEFYPACPKALANFVSVPGTSRSPMTKSNHHTNSVTMWARRLHLP